ncbi:MAG: 6-pyruvoyltetrahydropterin/6-carboxytetrahydropterin synthase [Cyclobacteriaceae bacterium]
MIVTAKGDPASETGIVVDFNKQSLMIKSGFTVVDYKDIYLDVNFMIGQITSCENLVIKFWEILEPNVNLLGADIYSIH